MNVSYINWLQKISIYETFSHIYVVGSDTNEQQFRLLRINRLPATNDETNLAKDNDRCCDDAVLDFETPKDRVWRLSIIEDDCIYNGSQLARLLYSIQAKNRVYFKLICSFIFY